MTKQELITALELKYSEVGTTWATVKSSYLGYDLLSIPVLEKEGSSAWENNVLVWKKGEVYLWKNGEPKSGGNTFTDRLKVYISSKVGDGTIKFATVKDSNDTIKKAKITTIMPDRTSKTLLVSEGKVNSFSYEVIA